MNHPTPAVGLMAMGGGDLFSPTAAILTIALLAMPPLMLLDSRLRHRPRLHMWAPRLPFLLMLLALASRITPLTALDGRDAQVAATAADGVTGLLHIFDGQAGMVLAILTGFSLYIFAESLRGWSDAQRLRHLRWSAPVWICLLGWGMPENGFALSQEAAALQVAASPPFGYGGWALACGWLLAYAISTLVKVEVAGARALSKKDFATSALLLCLWFVLAAMFADEGGAFHTIMAAPLAIVAATGHAHTSLRIFESRGLATRRFAGLMRTVMHGFVLLLIGSAYILSVDPAWSSFADAIWSLRRTLALVLVAGLAGAISPVFGFDARPRAEAWGWHLGLILAVLLLPGIDHMETVIPIVFILAITMPILATHVERRPDLHPVRRVGETLVVLAFQIGVIAGVAMLPQQPGFALEIWVLCTVLLAVILHESLDLSSADEEE